MRASPRRSLLSSMFHSPEAEEIFSDEARIQTMLDFEAALAKVEGSLSIIPVTAASAVLKCCRVEQINFEELARRALDSGNLAIPLIAQLTALVATEDGEAAGYVHWGATSQDMLDTAAVLQFRRETHLLQGTLRRLCHLLAELTERYRATPMAGRTLLQHAVPITLGLKIAGWLDAMLRHDIRLDELRPRLLVLQFGGAAGTLGALESQGHEVAKALAAELDLELPATPWHGHRDRFVELAMLHGLIAGTVSKIARDLSLLMQTEIAEMAEPMATGRGGSSAMPHKSNPVLLASILAATLRIPALITTVLSTMDQEHERGLGGWQAEWQTLPDICTLTLGSLERLSLLIEGINIYPEAMRSNIERTNGLLFAEAVSMKLAIHVGRAKAHRRIELASMSAKTSGQHLRKIIEQDEMMMEHFDSHQLDLLFDPLNYVGDAAGMIDRVLNEYRSQIGAI